MLKKRIIKELLIMCIVMFGLILTGCQEPVVQQNYEDIANIDCGSLSRYVDLKYIDIDMSQLSQKDTAVYNLYIEARCRVDQYVEFKDGQYTLGIDKGKIVGISDELFEYFKRIIVSTNENIKDLCVVETESKVLRVLNMNSEVNLNGIQKNRSEGGGSMTTGGITLLYTYWYGFHLYISSQDLQRIALGLTTVTGIAARCGAQGAVIASISLMCSVSFQYLAVEYPNGLDLYMEFLDDNGDSCVHASLQSQ